MPATATATARVRSAAPAGLLRQEDPARVEADIEVTTSEAIGAREEGAQEGRRFSEGERERETNALPLDVFFLTSSNLCPGLRPLEKKKIF
jgi:hypothetical protein